MTYTIIPTDWHTDRVSLMRIRELVFIREQQVPVADEWDDKDETATHFLVRSAKGQAIACARLLTENWAGQTVFHIGRVAVLAAYRQQAIGRSLMQAVVAYCNEQHPEYKIYLHAQTSRQRFYEHLAFVAQGTIFMDAGIPHIEMWHVKQAAEKSL